MLKMQVWKSVIGAIVALWFCCQPNCAQSIYTNSILVDCSGNTSGWLPSINAALQIATTGTYIYVMPGTTCHEDVFIDHQTTLALTTSVPKTFNLVGHLAVGESRAIYIGGMNQSGAGWDGVNVSHSDDVTFGSCTSTYNPGNGINVGGSSTVSVEGTGVYDYNGASGLLASENSTLWILAWTPTPIDISNNVNSGIHMDRSVLINLGNTTITNNQMAAGAGFPSGFGIDEYGGAKAELFALFGPITIASNQGGGISLMETSEISMGGGTSWAPYLLTIQGNGPLGIFEEFGSQVTLIGGTQILDHATAGIDVYGNSQVSIYNGSNQIIHNGFGLDAARAGIRVEGGSQVYMRNATVVGNGGPGVLGLVNSSLDIAESSFSSNAAGAVVCDGSAALVTDLPSGTLGAANSCKVHTSSGGRHGNSANFPVPDWRRQKAAADKMDAMASSHRK
jgi:Right handed beta helix region